MTALLVPPVDAPAARGRLWVAASPATGALRWAASAALVPSTLLASGAIVALGLAVADLSPALAGGPAAPRLSDRLVPVAWLALAAATAVLLGGAVVGAWVAAAHRDLALRGVVARRSTGWILASWLLPLTAPVAARRALTELHVGAGLRRRSGLLEGWSWAWVAATAVPPIAVALSLAVGSLVPSAAGLVTGLAALACTLAALALCAAGAALVALVGRLTTAIEG